MARKMFIVALVAWMLLILSFSAQPADQSSVASRAVVKAIIDAMALVLSIADAPQEKALLVAQLHNLVRKAAHVFNYLILGLLSYNAFLLSGRIHAGARLFAAAAVFCMVFAGMDEGLQRLIPGRSSQLFDVLLDSVSAVVGISACWLLRRGREKI